MIHGDFASSNTLYDRLGISAVLNFEFAGPDIRVMNVASGLKYSIRTWENADPWIGGDHFCRGYARLVTLTEPEIAAVVESTILRDTVSLIGHFGRSLAEGWRPEQKHLEDVCDSAAWLEAHRSDIEALIESALP